jgi:hypothetical protein
MADNELDGTSTPLPRILANTTDLIAGAGAEPDATRGGVEARGVTASTAM